MAYSPTPRAMTWEATRPVRNGGSVGVVMPLTVAMANGRDSIE